MLMLFVLLNLPLFSQVLNQHQQVVDEDIVFRIKQLGEFIDRFNYEKDFFNLPINDSFSQLIKRDEYVRLLFNMEDAYLGLNCIDAYNDYEDLVSSFINEVVSNDLKLNLCSEKIFVKVTAEVEHENSTKQIIITLKKECSDGHTSSWKIAGVDFAPFRIPKSATYISIPPSSNETSFIDLNRIINSNLYLLPDHVKEINYDQVSVFYYAVSKNQITLKHIEDLQYFILDFKPWVIKIRENNTGNYNTGWLIDDLFYLSQNEIYEFLRDSLFISYPSLLINDLNETKEDQSFSLRSFCPPIKSHGPLKSSTAWSVAYYTMGIYNAIRTKNDSGESLPTNGFSPYYLHKKLTSQNQTIDCSDDDIDLNEALYFTKHYGLIGLDESSNICISLVKNFDYSNIKKTFLEDYVIINPSFSSIEYVSDIIRAILLKNMPVIATIRSDKEFLKLNEPVWIPSENEDNLNIVNTITVIGFNDEKYGGSFEIVFNRGKNWGADGFCYIRYVDFNNVIVDAYELFF